MRLGLVVPSERRSSGADLIAIAQTAEQVGYATLWVTDHIVFPRVIRSQYPYGGQLHIEEDGFFLDPLITLAFLASATSVIEFGTDVLVASLRRPVVLANALGSLGYLADRRILVGLGSGWLREEFDLVGADFENRIDDLVAVLELLGGVSEPRSANGLASEIRLEPFGAPGAGRMPVLLGGLSPAARRRAALTADGWIGVGSPVGTFAQHRDWMVAQAAGQGRDLENFHWVTSGLVSVTRERRNLDASSPYLEGTVDELIMQLNAFASAGATEYIVFPRVKSSPRWVDEYVAIAAEVGAAFLEEQVARK